MERQEQIRIVIVDNDVKENDEKRQQILQKYRNISNVMVIQIREDKGFSYANNQGYEYARTVLKSSYIVVANNDIEFLQKNFVELLENNIDKEADIVGPDIIKRKTGEHQNPLDERIRSKEEALSTIKKNTMALKFYNILYPVLYWNFKKFEGCEKRNADICVDIRQNKRREIVLFGACLIFMPSFVEREEKAFAPETKFYYEEYILAYRCMKEGYIMVYDPTLAVVHETGGATKKTYSSEKKRLKFVMEQTVASCKIYLKLMAEK